jgi:hypothetical protein
MASAASGFVVIALTIYGWGQFTAFWNMARAALGALAEEDPELFGSLQLPALSPWPLIVAILLLAVVVITLALSLWGSAALIDLRLDLAKEERQARQAQGAALANMESSLRAIAQYFASLPPPRR